MQGQGMGYGMSQPKDVEVEGHEGHEDEEGSLW